uniref:Uncharacterized protein n=1 Tax=Arundo donax TaxID=35708 RepID=A0A0A9E2W2_ARUDO
MHNAAAPLLRHELLPPPHELRTVLPHHPCLQRRHERGRPARVTALRRRAHVLLRKGLGRDGGFSADSRGKGRETWSLSETSESTRISRETSD